MSFKGLIYLLISTPPLPKSSMDSSALLWFQEETCRVSNSIIIYEYAWTFKLGWFSFCLGMFSGMHSLGYFPPAVTCVQSRMLVISV